MKDSGVEWLGKIPAHWKISKLKYLFSFGKGLTITKENLTEIGVPVISYGQIHSKNNLGTTVKRELIRFVPETFLKTNKNSLVDKFDFIFADTSEDLDGCGNCIYIDKQMDLFAGYHSIILRSREKTDKKYLAYLFLTDAWRYQIRSKVSGVKVFSISQKILSQTFIILPPLDEQKKIADFLDKKCSAIDSAVDAAKKMVETLAGYKKSLITETVTKGLNPSAKMIDSGVEWLGEIPAHWKICRVKNIFSLRSERNYLPLEKVQLLSLYSDIGVFKHGEFEEKGNKATTADGYKEVYPDDIVVNIILAWMGAIGHSDYRGVTSPAYDIYRPKKNICSKFYHYVFRTSGFSGECYKYGRGIMEMRWRTYSAEFKAIKIPLPPIDEQKKIAAFLDRKCSAIDESISAHKNLAEKLSEYKKSLIYEVVTGKREVL